MPSEGIKKLILKRDDGICWHCGSDQTTLHHRQNRRMGGDKTRAKTADRPSNLLTICPQFNSLMESDVNALRMAKEKGWKLRLGELSTHTPVYNFDGTWWYLTDHGTKFEITDDSME